VGRNDDVMSSSLRKLSNLSVNELSKSYIESVSTGNSVREGEPGQELVIAIWRRVGMMGKNRLEGGLPATRKQGIRRYWARRVGDGETINRAHKTGIIAAGFLLGGRASHRAAWDNLQEC
jgi:hypothetical protein